MMVPPDRIRRTLEAGGLAAALAILIAMGPAPAAAQTSDVEQARYTQGLRSASELLANGRTEDAIITLRTLTARFPSRPEAFNNLAVLYARQGQLERARDLLTRSMNTHPSYATTFQNLSEVLAQLAARAYDAALDNKPTERAPPALALIDTASPPAPLMVAEAAAPPRPTPPAPTPRAEPQPPAPSRPLTRAAAPVAAATPAAPAPSEAATRPPVNNQSPQAGSETAAAAAPAAVKTTLTASAPKKRPASDPRLAQVLATVEGWAQAWSDQDVERYLSYYDSRFTPAKGLSRDAWKQQRQVRLTRPSRIRVEVRGPKVKLQGKDRATVRFRQRYRSNTLKSTATKTLRLIKRGERWRILEERV